MARVGAATRYDPAMAELSPSPVGRLLREWRTARGQSQLALALEAGVSARHLSFVETGRATPSRELVLELARALEMPLRERNMLLTSAGYAPALAETPPEAPRMDSVRRVLEALLHAHRRNPTVAVNRHCDVIMANEAAQRLFIRLLPPAALPLTSNIVRLIFSPDGARPFIDNWDEVAGEIAFRLRRESPTQATDPLRDILGPEIPLRDKFPHHPIAHTPTLALPIRIRKGELRLDLFTAITTLGTPLDVTLQELRVESLFAADAATEAQLEAILGPIT